MLCTSSLDHTHWLPPVSLEVYVFSLIARKSRRDAFPSSTLGTLSPGTKLSSRICQTTFLLLDHNATRIDRRFACSRSRNDQKSHSNALLSLGQGSGFPAGRPLHTSAEQGRRDVPCQRSSWRQVRIHVGAAQRGALSLIRPIAGYPMSSDDLSSRSYRDTSVCSTSDTDQRWTYTEHLYHAPGGRCKNHLRDAQDLGLKLQTFAKPRRFTSLPADSRSFVRKESLHSRIGQ